MQSNIAVTRKMIEYAKRHHLTVPKVSTWNPVWGNGKRTLAWRVSGHAFGEKHASAQKTQRLCDLLFPLTFGEWVVRIAAGELGVTEHPAGSNDGPRVRAYQSTTGAYRQPWCASFRKWVEVEAAHRTHRKLGWFANPAWVPNWTHAAGGSLYHRIDFADAKAGDFVTLWGSKHIETVVKREGDYLICIGGNTSPVGQNANGGGVFRTRRHRSEVTAIGRRR